MKIAVTSQNRKTITGHAGKCRKFWIYEAADGQVQGRTLLELPIDQSFRNNQGQCPHPLDNVHVLISGGMGGNLQHRLRQRGIDALVTTETDPDRAVAAYLTGSLPLGEADSHAGHPHASTVFMAGTDIPTHEQTEKEPT